MQPLFPCALCRRGWEAFAGFVAAMKTSPERKSGADVEERAGGLLAKWVARRPGQRGRRPAQHPLPDSLSTPLLGISVWEADPETSRFLCSSTS